MPISHFRSLTFIAAFSLAAAAAAGPLQFSASFTPTLDLTSIRAYAAYGSGNWARLTSVDSASAGLPSMITATTADGADGRFVLMGIYTIPATNLLPEVKGVSVVMTTSDAAYSLDDGYGIGRLFNGTNPLDNASGVFPFYQESVFQTYLENDGNVPYLLDNYDFAHQTNHAIIGGGAGTIVNFSNATAGGVASITVTPVPEPASIAALGLGAIALVRRRRQRNAG